MLDENVEILYKGGQMYNRSAMNELKSISSLLDGLITVEILNDIE
jgi:hypothetical protein